MDQGHGQDHGARWWTSGVQDHRGPLKNIFLMYLKKISITKGTHELEATPFELWFGKKPKVEHLRVWGISAYAYIHRGNISDKE